VVDLNQLLEHLHDQGGSDLHVKAGSAPRIRVDGRLQTGIFEVVDAAALEALADGIVPDNRRADLDESGEIDFAYSVSGLGRFRVNVHRQRGSVALVVHRVVPGIPDVDGLGLPAAVERLAAEPRGLVLVTGPSGSGKTSTVATIVDQINATRDVHIVTIEDPIEVLHADKRAIVTQREVGTDTPSYRHALERALRHDPDVIFVGELRDAETVTAAIAASNTGSLVISTMPTLTAVETIASIVDMFPPAQHRQLRHALGTALRGILSQRLLERADGKGRTPAVEVLVATAKVFDCIVDAERFGDLDRVISEGEYYGMQSFDTSLQHLVKDGLVSVRDAMSVAVNPDDLRIAFQQIGLGGGL
jgi:twitching motility protein PilT